MLYNDNKGYLLLSIDLNYTSFKFSKTEYSIKVLGKSFRKGDNA